MTQGTRGARDERDDANPLDRIALDLQELREAAGAPSYAELVRRIARIRLERGVPAAAATRPRSTVYNAFATGRARMDTELLRDIVVALGASGEEADAWVRRCREAQRAPRPAPAPPRPSAASTAAPPPPRPLPRGFAPLLLLGCVLANLLGLLLASGLGLHVYLDMVGTAMAAILLGPWHGVGVALATSAVAMLGTGSSVDLPFALVGCVGALVWGYGVGRFGMGRSLSRYFALGLVTALACSVVATPVVVLTFGDHQAHGSQQITDSMSALGLPLLAAAFSSNVVTSIMDKLLTGFVVLTGLTLLHEATRMPTDRVPVVERLTARRVARPARRIGIASHP